jgi:hypothetical protein
MTAFAESGRQTIASRTTLTIKPLGNIYSYAGQERYLYRDADRGTFDRGLTFPTAGRLLCSQVAQFSIACWRPAPCSRRLLRLDFIRCANLDIQGSRGSHGASRLNGNSQQESDSLTPEAFDCRFRRGIDSRCAGRRNGALASADAVGHDGRVGATIHRRRALRAVPTRLSFESQSEQRTVHRTPRDRKRNRDHRLLAWFRFVRFRVCADARSSRRRIVPLLS